MKFITATVWQVKYEDIRSKYEEDVKGLIDTKLLLAEAAEM